MIKPVIIRFDIEDVENISDIPARLRKTYRKLVKGDEETRQGVADAVTSKTECCGGAFAYAADPADLFGWLCANGYVSLSLAETETAPENKE